MSFRAVRGRPALRADPSGPDLVAGHVHQRIFDGVLRRGDELVPGELADELQVGRPAVRAGLRRLETGGWVRVPASGAAVVVGIDRAFIEDHMALKGFTWTLLLRRIRDPESRADLHALAVDVAEATDADALLRTSQVFVRALLAAADAPRAAALLRATAPLVPGNLFAVVPGAMALQQRGAPAIGQSLQRAALARACTIAVEHHRALGELVSDLLTTRGVLS